MPASDQAALFRVSIYSCACTRNERNDASRRGDSYIYIATVCLFSGSGVSPWDGFTAWSALILKGMLPISNNNVLEERSDSPKIQLIALSTGASPGRFCLSDVGEKQV